MSGVEGQGWLIKNEKSCNYKSPEHVSDEVLGVRPEGRNMTGTTQLPSVISRHNSALEGHPFFGPSRMRHSKSEAFESIILDNVSTAHLLQTTVTTKFGFQFQPTIVINF